MNRKIRILCVDDHPIVREGLTSVIALQPDMELAGAAESGAEALELFRATAPDVALVDLRLQDMTGHELTRKILSFSPEARIVILTSFEGDADIERALAAGARGYLVKGVAREDLLGAIRSVHADGISLKTLPSIWPPKSSANASCSCSDTLSSASAIRRLAQLFLSLKVR